MTWLCIRETFNDWLDTYLIFSVTIHFYNINFVDNRKPKDVTGASQSQDEVAIAVRAIPGIDI